MTHESRRLNLRVAPSFGVRWLGPRLSSFLATNPAWDIRVDAAPDPTDFDRELMDLDIRYGLGNWAGYHSVPILPDLVLPLCSPGHRDALLADVGDPTKVLRTAKLIDSARALCQWDYWLARQGIADAKNEKSVLIDRSSMAIQLAVDGIGVVLESITLAAQEMQDGALVPLTPDLPVISFPAYWAVCPNRYVRRRAVSVFMDWLQTAAQEHSRDVDKLMARHGLRPMEIDGLSELVASDISIT